MGNGPAMSCESTHLVTQILDAIDQGTPGAHDRLWELVYTELHQMAQAQLRQEHGAVTLQPTALVHEAYMRLVAGNNGHFENRRHFFAAAAKSMRRIRVDDARRRRRIKRGGPGLGMDGSCGSLENRTNLAGGPESDSAFVSRRSFEDPAVFDQDPAEVMATDEVLEQLEQEHPRMAQIIDLRYFVGLTVDQTADILGISSRTVDSEWRLAKAWLHRRLAGCDT